MKKLLVVLSLTLGLGFVSAQQTAKKQATPPPPPSAEKQLGKNTSAEMPPSLPAQKEPIKTKKDGTPDKRYKANKQLKKDGTPDKRYKKK